MSENLARYKIRTGITTSCREQRMLAPPRLARPPHRKPQNPEPHTES